MKEESKKNHSMESLVLVLWNNFKRFLLISVMLK